MPSYADWVSTGALVLSGLLAAREIGEARRAAPKISVTTDYTAELPEKHVQVGLTVTNTGTRPVTITAVGWEIPTKVAAPRDGSVQATLGRGDITPALPYRLDGNDAIGWTWPPSLTDKLITFGSFRGFVETGGQPAPTRLLRLLRRTSAHPHRFHPGGGTWMDTRLLQSMHEMWDDGSRDSGR